MSGGNRTRTCDLFCVREVHGSSTVSTPPHIVVGYPFYRHLLGYKCPLRPFIPLGDSGVANGCKWADEGWVTCIPVFEIFIQMPLSDQEELIRVLLWVVQKMGCRSYCVHGVHRTMGIARMNKKGMVIHRPGILIPSLIMYLSGIPNQHVRLFDSLITSMISGKNLWE